MKVIDCNLRPNLGRHIGVYLWFLFSWWKYIYIDLTQLWKPNFIKQKLIMFDSKLSILIVDSSSCLKSKYTLNIHTIFCHLLNSCKLIPSQVAFIGYKGPKEQLTLQEIRHNHLLSKVMFILSAVSFHRIVCLYYD